MKIYQLAFVRDLVIEKRLTNCNANIIFMNVEFFIKMTDLENYKEANLYIYQRLVGKLIYFWYNIRLDIIFVLEQLSRHNANLRKNHLWAIKKVVRYLKETIKMSLTFGQKSTEQSIRDLLPYGLIGYISSNFIKDSKGWKLVMSHYFFLNRALVFWSSKK